MSSDVEKAQLRHELRASTVQSGFSIRQSEETMKILQKENFNLKLKIFLLESKRGVRVDDSELDDASEKEYIDLFLENEQMRVELEENRGLLRTSLEAIQRLEDQKTEYERKCQSMMIAQQIQTFKLWKVKPRKHRWKKLQIKCSPAIDQKDSKLVHSMRAHNRNLLQKIRDLEMDISTKIKTINQLVTANLKLENQLDQNQEQIDDLETEIAQLSDELVSSKSLNPTSLRNRNEKLEQENSKWTVKCRKLERDNEDLERIVNEQSGLMKVLNRAIEIKNEELTACKNRVDFDFSTTSSSTSDIYCPEDLNLNEIKFSKSSLDSTNYPFHNPLFGDYVSKYS